MAQDDIQGQVVDAQGNPVDGAIVELTKSYQSSPLDEQVVRRTTTDANGNYIFEFHPDGDGTTQEWHVSAYNHDGTAYVNSFNNPGVTADLPSNLIPDGLVDNFEPVLYEDQDATLSTYYSGDLAKFSRQQSVVKEGNYALAQDSTGARETIINTGRDVEIQQDDTVRGWVREDNQQGRVGIVFFVQDVDNYYWAAKEGGADELRLLKLSGGSRSLLDSAAISTSLETWYELEVLPQSDGTLNATLYDDQGSSLASVSASDSDYTSGDTGFASNQGGGNSGATFYWDNTRIV